MVRAALLSLFGLLSSSCGAFDEIDYTGKTCPCPAEYGCSTTGTCCQPAIRGENFHVAWTAPNTIRFEWDPIGDEASFSAYRMRFGVGTDPTGPSTEITGVENPHFRYFVLPEVADSNQRVDSAMLLELEPSTPYWAQLEAFDSAGCVWTSPVVFATTAVEPLADQVPIEIFDEVWGGWASGPAGVNLFVSDRPERAGCGMNFLEWTQATMTNEDTNLQIYQLGIPLAPAGERIASSAFIEYKIARDSDSYWARVVLAVANPNFMNGGPHARLEGMSLRGDDRYYRVQVPIRELGLEANAVPFAAGDTLHRFLVGFSPAEVGATMRVDCVKIRW